MGRPRIVDWEVTGTLRCTRCQQTKPMEEFYRDRTRPSGRESRCAACKQKHPKEWYKQRPKVKSNPDYARKCGLKRMYGLSLEQYDAIFQAQDGLCMVCRHPETLFRRGRTSPLSVDHDHQDGHVRGLLCNRCNRALGLLRDDPEVVEALLTYLWRDQNERKRSA